MHVSECVAEDDPGNVSSPNTFSYNLLNNLGNLTGSKPIIRVGGNTQDYATYDANLKVATNGTFTSNSQDYPTILSIGSSYFESYSTWPDVQFVHGFNLANNGSVGYNTLVATVPLACNALSGAKLFAFELGNEPDLYKTSAQGATRQSSWNEQTYVNEWLNKTRLIKSLVNSNCSSRYGYIAPSFAGTHNSLDPVKPWHDGLDADNNIKQISSHKSVSPTIFKGHFSTTQYGLTFSIQQLHLRRHLSWRDSARHADESHQHRAEYLLPAHRRCSIIQLQPRFHPWRNKFVIQ